MSKERSFVVATHGGLYLFVLDANFEISNSQVIDDAYHYGVTVDRDAATGTATIYAYRGGPGRQDVLPREIRVWNFDGQTVTANRVIPLDEDKFGDVHQISKCGRGGYLLANTRYNAIDRWTPEDGLLSRIHINDVQTDANHVNSVFPVEDLVCVMLHNFRKLESQIVILEDDGVDFQELGRFSLKDWCCHNIGVLGHFMYINASSTQALVKIDLRTLKELHRKKFHAHTKGLASDGEFLFSGMSDCAARAERVKSNGWIYVVEPDELTVQKSIQLETPDRGKGIGNVNEIRLLNMPDLFDKPSGVDVEVLRNSVDVEQSAVGIACRRTWIRAVDKVRRTVGAMLPK